MSFDILNTAASGIVFATFGEPVTLHQEGLAPFTVRGIFMAEYEAVDVRAGVPVTSTQPMVELRESELPDGVEEGDSLLIRGKRYSVVDVRADGYGTFKVFLHKAGSYEQD